MCRHLGQSNEDLHKYYVKYLKGDNCVIILKKSLLVFDVLSSHSGVIR